MRKIYGISKSTAFRTLWMADEIGLDFEQIVLDFSKNEHKSPEYLKINPNGAVPCLVEDDGYTIWESMAINWYLCDKYKPELLGADVGARGLAIQWSFWASVSLDERFRGYIIERWYGQNRQEVLDAHLAAITKAMPIIDAHLAGKEFVAGGKFTVADVNIGSVVGWSTDIEYDLSPFPNAKRHLGAMSTRPAYKKASARR